MKYIEMCYYTNPVIGDTVETNSEALEPRFPLVYGIQDDLKIDVIDLKSADPGRLFTWNIKFKKMNGGALDVGDVETIKVTASIGDQDSTPRSLSSFTEVLEKSVERLNMDLITFGKTYLTFEVTGEAGDDGIEPLWNCTCFSLSEITTKVAP